MENIAILVQRSANSFTERCTSVVCFNQFSAMKFQVGEVIACEEVEKS
jgi:tRNA-binding EMAP/Myf-like protein